MTDPTQELRARDHVTYSQINKSYGLRCKHPYQFISERLVILRGVHGGDTAVFHNHGKAHHAQDADADGGRQRLQEFLHHLRHVLASVLLRARWDHCLWKRQVRRGNWKVIYIILRLIFLLLYVCIYYFYGTLSFHNCDVICLSYINVNIFSTIFTSTTVFWFVRKYKLWLMENFKKLSKYFNIFRAITNYTSKYLRHI